MDMVIKLGMLIVFFGIMIGTGFYCRKHSADVDGFVLGGRSVGPWLTAFAYGTSYFSAVVFVGYAGQFGWKYVIVGIVAVMLAGLIIVPAMSLVTKPPQKEHIRAVFSCYDKKVVVSVTDAIGEPIQKEEIR